MELILRGYIEKIKSDSNAVLYLIKGKGRTYEVKVDNHNRTAKEPFKKGDIVDLWKKPDFVNYSFLLLKTNRVREERYYK